MLKLGRRPIIDRKPEVEKGNVEEPDTLSPSEKGGIKYRQGRKREKGENKRGLPVANRKASFVHLQHNELISNTKCTDSDSPPEVYLN
jgi:hypothetical protein